MTIEKHPKIFPIIQTRRLSLRELSLSDINDVFDYASEEEITKYVIWEAHKSKADSEQFILFLREMFEKKEQIVWGIEYQPDKKVIGTIGFVNIQWKHQCAEIGYALSKQYWNKGIASEALKAVIEFGFNQLWLNRQEAHCKEENIASEKVMLRAGMSYEGTLREKIFMKGEFWTMKMFSILRKEYYDKN